MRTCLLAACLAAATAIAAPNPLSRAPDPLALNGRWNGVNLENRSDCRTPENNGSRGTYAQFDVVADAQGNLAITQSGITGLNCSYGGRYEVAGRLLSWQGSYNCTDGKRGDFQSRSIELHALSVGLPARNPAHQQRGLHDRRHPQHDALPALISAVAAARSAPRGARAPPAPRRSRR
jgi:hypothetical protein